MAAPIVIVSTDGKIVAANDRFRNEFGEPLDRFWQEFLANDKSETATTFDGGSQPRLLQLLDRISNR